MTPDDDKSADDIGQSAQRLKDAREHPGPSPLTGIGAFGMIGWSIAVPTVSGVFLGLWLDKIAPQNFSWTIALLFGGVVLGAVIAWRWIDKEADKK